MLDLKRIALGALVVLVGMAAVLWPEIPAWRSGGTNALAMASVARGDPESLCPSPGGTIALRGDSHVAGARMGETAPAYPQIMQQLLAQDIRVAARGIGGLNAPMAERHWPEKPVEGEVVLLAFGTNDAAPRGWMGGKEPIALSSFKASLTRQIAGLRREGARVGLIAPPPAGSTAMNRRLSPYRKATAAVGEATGTPVLDPADAFASCKSSEPLLTYDALHMNPAGHQCLGRWLARQVCPLAAAS